jgi:hypothetical protein
MKNDSRGEEAHRGKEKRRHFLHTHADGEESRAPYQVDDGEGQ